MRGGAMHMESERDTSPTAKAKARTCVRTGCNTCKIRKVKCDEARPKCNRCESTGRTCDGYFEPPPIQRKRSPKYGGPPKSLSIYRPPEHVSENVLDRRCFAYFRCRVVQDISGCFEVDFWDRLVPQVGHAEPTVHHALLALSSLYESYASQGKALPESPETKLALKHYTKAVGLLANDLASNLPSPQVILVSCLVFVWFEFIRNNPDTALNHLQAGIRILSDMEHSGPVPSFDSSLPRFFTRLQVQARQHGSPTSDFNSNISGKQPATLNVMPSTFRGLVDARSCLDTILDSLSTFSRQLYHATLSPFEVYQQAAAPEKLSLEATRRSLLEKLQEWHFTFQNTPFDSFSSTKNPKTTAGILLLQLHHTVAYKVAQTAVWSSEMAYDELMADYQRIISLAEQLIRETGSVWIGNPIIYFDIGVIEPLFFVSIKCRHPIIRRKAISLLKQAPDREGMWVRDACVQFAEMKMRMEEYGYETLLEGGGTLPASARIFHEQAGESVVEGMRVTVLRYKQGGIDFERIINMSATMGEVA